MTYCGRSRSGKRVGTAVAVSVRSGAWVAGISVGGGRGVAVKTRGVVGDWGEQETIRNVQKIESRMRAGMCWGMKSILTEIVGTQLFANQQKSVSLLTKKPPARFLMGGKSIYLSDFDCFLPCATRPNTRLPDFRW